MKCSAVRNFSSTSAFTLPSTKYALLCTLCQARIDSMNINSPTPPLFQQLSLRLVSVLLFITYTEKCSLAVTAREEGEYPHIHILVNTLPSTGIMPTSSYLDLSTHSFLCPSSPISPSPSPSFLFFTFLLEYFPNRPPPLADQPHGIKKNGSGFL